MLDGFQAGLSWITILRKRDNFRAAFEGFHPETIAEYGDAQVERLLADGGIVRHRGKIEATIGNARAYLRLAEHGSFSDYLWRHVDGIPIQNSPRSMADVPAKTPLSEAISKQLKKDGFKFCGPTIVYAVMQAMGMVNDHMVDCPRHAACAALAPK
jgi:DNA-3-methyladenine glycosylase I